VVDKNVMEHFCSFLNEILKKPLIVIFHTECKTISLNVILKREGSLGVQNQAKIITYHLNEQKDSQKLSKTLTRS